MERIDRIVSLGGMCEVAYRARSATGCERAYPFDWWATPIQSVPALLDGRCQDLFAPERLVKVPDFNGRPILVSTTPGTSHIHEFKTGENFLDDDPEAISARLTAKYAFLWSRLVEDCSRGRTLFIRQRMNQDRAGPELVAEIEARLATLAPDFRLLLLDYEEPLARSERVLQRTVAQHSDAGDLGSRRGWDETLATLPFAIARQSGRVRLDDLRATYHRRRPLDRIAAWLDLRRFIPNRG